MEQQTKETDSSKLGIIENYLLELHKAKEFGLEETNLISLTNKREVSWEEARRWIDGKIADYSSSHLYRSDRGCYAQNLNIIMTEDKITSKERFVIIDQDRWYIDQIFFCGMYVANSYHFQFYYLEDRRFSLTVIF